ncbi:uncharacterized protein LOC128230743 [Mya arenaria]|uniref:uncharacterized protein LOC128230743 n=1 Tax=Mya arenaria TaxID=6604 RepID=UPI0022E0616B|nr:uncharacterized protein LOC128230743 [Mya arenaria]
MSRLRKQRNDIAHVQQANGALSHSNGFYDNNGDAHAQKANDTSLLSNGFHDNNKEATKTDETTGIVHMIDFLLNKFVLPICMIIFLPIISIFLWYTNTHCEGSFKILYSRVQDGSSFGLLAQILGNMSIFNKFTCSVVFGYFAWALFWMKVLPGKTVNGPMTAMGNIPVYKNNGFLHYGVTMVGFAILTLVLKQYGLSPTIVYDRFGELLVFINVFALVFVLFLCLKGLYFPSSSDSGKTGHGFIFDYYWGTELYPRILGIDIKVLTNCRFGMTIWPLLVCTYALKSYELHGFVDSMFVTTVLQLIYITKFFSWEAGYMHTMDIIVDRAGWYICWGCLSWLPEIYPLVSQYLKANPVRLGWPLAFTILVLGLAFILINYQADLQRQQVRSADGQCLVWGLKPEIIRAKYMNDGGQENESILLASGWWGVSRHFHYMPEILLSFSWTAPVGFVNLLPYSYVIYLIILLVHRSFRDENKCRRKYGRYWQEYCEKVPYKIVPFIF